MKKILNTVLFYGATFLLFTSVFLLLFRLPFFSGQKVLFYRGLWLLIVTIIIFAFTVYIVRSILKFSNESYIAAILVSASINLSLFVVLPVTFERSVTIYLLNTLEAGSQNTCNGLTKKQLEEKLINEYVVKNKAIDKRTNEQEIIGFVEEKNRCLTLTPRAKNFLKLSETIGRIYDLK